MNNYIIVLFLLYRINSKIIPIIVSKIGGQYSIKTLFTDKGKLTNQYFSVTLVKDYTWVSSRYYSLLNSANEIEKGTMIIQDKYSIPYKKINQRMTLKDYITLENFTFYYYDRSLIDPNELSLSLHTEHSSSLIYQLYEAKYIDSLSFSIIAQEGDNNECKIELNLGGIPEQFNNKKSRKCIVNKDNKSWGCTMNKVIIGDYSYYNNYSMIFQLSDHGIKAPTAFMNYLQHEIFKEYIDNGQCRFMLYTFNFLECECSVFDSIPYISFYIDGYEYKLYKSNFIMCLPKSCKLDIVDNYFDNTTWEFSLNFLKEYSLLFNYTESSITFYNDSTFNSNVNLIYIVIILLCSIGICIKYVLIINI